MLCLLVPVRFPAQAAPPAPAAGGGVVSVAVAADFLHTLEHLGTAFARTGAGRLAITPGSTGKLYAQIRAGAPFDILLSADTATPLRLVRDKLAVAASRFTYARGRLVLWSRSARRVDGSGRVLASGRFRHLAIADPDTAPYGAAARNVLRRLGLWQRLQPRIVSGEDVGQTFEFAASGNAALAFVALAQIKDPGHAAGGSYWIVPQRLYPPINQQAVLLTRAAHNRAAAAFMRFLHGAAARTIIRQDGYGTD